MNKISCINFAHITLLVMMSGVPALADNYFIEGGIDYRESEDDFTEAKTTGVHLEYYLSPVVTGNGPFAEAGFLSQASFVGIDYRKNDVDAKPPTSFLSAPQFSIPPQGAVGIPGFDPDALNSFAVLPASIISVAATTFPPEIGISDSDLDTIRLFGRYVFNHGYFLSAGYETGDDSTNSSLQPSSIESSDEVDNVSLGFGKYLNGSTLIGLSFSQADNKHETNSDFQPCPIGSFCLMRPPISATNKTTTNRWQFNAKRVWQIGDRAHTVEGNIAHQRIKRDNFATFFSFQGASATPIAQPSMFSDKSSASELGLSYTYYPKNTLGFSAGYTLIDGDFSDSRGLNLGVQWFAQAKIAVEAGYTRLDAEQSFADSDGFSLGVVGRY